MTRPVLTFSGVRFSYHGAEVLDGIDLAIPSGEVTALMGPSGCGKSTLVSIAAGLLEPTSGLVHRSYQRAAVMFQDPLLLPWRTARDNVGFVLKADRLDASERRERAEAMLATVGLAREDFDKFPRQLSGGMRQRVALARALVVDPDLLLLDEPFTGLDVGLARHMLSLVRKLVTEKQVAALVVTHDPHQAARFAERVYLLSARPARLLSSRELAPAKGVEAEVEAILSDLVAVGQVSSA